LALLCTVTANILYSYYDALAVWYATHLKLKLSKQNRENSDIAFNIQSGLVCLCCIGSVGLILGTIYWVRRMTITKDEKELKAGGLSLPTVLGHIFLLTLESVEVWLNVIGWSTAKFTLSTTHKIQCSMNVSIAFLDVFLCCLICF
jgi:hypothetical protein